MRDLRNHTREVIERAQAETVTITDNGVPVAIITALSLAPGWDADAWIERVIGADWAPYDSGLADEVAAARRADDGEPDASERLRLT